MLSCHATQVTSGLRRTIKIINFTNIDDHVNFNNDVLTLKQLTDREVIFSLNNQPEEPEKEEDSAVKELSVSTMFDAVKILSNYMVLNNDKSNFYELDEKKYSIIFVQKIMLQSFLTRYT